MSSIRPLVAALLGALCLLPASAQAGERAWSAIGPDGKEARLKKVRVTQGSAVLPLPPGSKSEFLEFREENSTLFARGIATLVPWNAVERIVFEPEKKSVTVDVLTAGDTRVSLKGTTRYLGINRLALEYDQEIAGLGLAHVKFRGGDPMTPAADFRLAGAAAVPRMPSGRKAWIVAQDKEKTRHEIVDARILYQVGAAQSFRPELHFKVDLKVPLERIRKSIALPADKKQPHLEFDVSLIDGTALKLTLVDPVKLNDPPATAKLIGLVGRVPAGYKLFPLHTIAELHLDEAPARKN